MSWWHGLSRNWAELDERAVDPALRPVVVPLELEEALHRAARAITEQTRWTILALDPAAGTLAATHSTRLWRFVDDVVLRFEPDSQGTRITGRSRSRIGIGDFGQNARNLKELAEVLKQLG